MHPGTMLNAYPDSIGNQLSDMVSFLSKPELKDAFRSFYILPTIFNTDIDRGFSVISYDLCNSLAKSEDLITLRFLGIDIMFDMILNHLSVLSPQFRDILKNGNDSKYRDFFIDWNIFWNGSGYMTEQGYIQPDPDKFVSLNLRKNFLPFLMVRFPDGTDVPYWNTFYQKTVYLPVNRWALLDIADGQYSTAVALEEHINSQIKNGLVPKDFCWNGFEFYRQPITDYLESHRCYLGQMDVNIQNPLVWEWYDSVMAKLSSLGASTIRLDAFTRLHKAPGRVNFMNEPETWEILSRLQKIAAQHSLEILPEIHAPYSSLAYLQLTERGCATYDYFLPGLLIDALDTENTDFLHSWASEQIEKNIHAVNMLGCHDGIPVRDLKGLLPENRISSLIERVCSRGGRPKFIHGIKQEVYQLDCTYYSALGCNDKKLLLARAIQMFMPGKPQIWYVDLLAGKNDLMIFETDPEADNREINRKRYELLEVEALLRLPVVKEQLRLLVLRNSHPAFSFSSSIHVEQPCSHGLCITWENNHHSISLNADLQSLTYRIDEN